MSQALLIRLAALLGALSVALGAFAAHGLRVLVGEAYLLTFETAVRYQFYHALAIGLAAAVYPAQHVSQRQLGWAVACWLGGILLFSGSLYLLSLREVHELPVAFLGPITPLGGLLLIAGWVLLLISPRRPADR